MSLEQKVKLRPVQFLKAGEGQTPQPPHSEHLCGGATAPLPHPRQTRGTGPSDPEPDLAHAAPRQLLPRTRGNLPTNPGSEILQNRKKVAGASGAGGASAWTCSFPKSPQHQPGLASREQRKRTETCSPPVCSSSFRSTGASASSPPAPYRCPWEDGGAARLPSQVADTGRRDSAGPHRWGLALRSRPATSDELLTFSVPLVPFVKRENINVFIS